MMKNKQLKLIIALAIAFALALLWDQGPVSDRNKSSDFHKYFVNITESDIQVRTTMQWDKKRSVLDDEYITRLNRSSKHDAKLCYSNGILDPKILHKYNSMLDFEYNCGPRAIAAFIYREGNDPNKNDGRQILNICSNIAKNDKFGLSPKLFDKAGRYNALYGCELMDPSKYSGYTDTEFKEKILNELPIGSSTLVYTRGRFDKKEGLMGHYRAISRYDKDSIVTNDGFQYNLRNNKTSLCDLVGVKCYHYVFRKKRFYNET